MRKPRPLPHPIATGPARLPKDPGDRLRLGDGLELVLIVANVQAPIFRATPAGFRPEVWTTAADRPGVFLKVGEFPPVLDAEELIKRATTAQVIAECLLDLDGAAA